MFQLYRLLFGIVFDVDLELCRLLFVYDVTRAPWLWVICNSMKIPLSTLTMFPMTWVVNIVAEVCEIFLPVYYGCDYCILLVIFVFIIKKDNNWPYTYNVICIFIHTSRGLKLQLLLCWVQPAHWGLPSQNYLLLHLFLDFSLSLVLWIVLLLLPTHLKC